MADPYWMPRALRSSASTRCSLGGGIVRYSPTIRRVSRRFRTAAATSRNATTFRSGGRRSVSKKPATTAIGRRSAEQCVSEDGRKARVDRIRERVGEQRLDANHGEDDAEGRQGHPLA